MSQPEQTRETGFFVALRKEVEAYVADRLLLVKMQSAATVAKVTSLMFTLLLLALVGFFVVFFLSIMAGFYLAAITNSYYIGFGLVGAWYVLFLVVLILTRKWYQQKIMDLVIRVFFDKNEEELPHD